jgi:hypothetical protein
MMHFADIVKVLMDREGLSMRRMVKGLNEYLPEVDRWSYGAVFGWINGGHVPSYTKLERISNLAPEGSWQRELAARGMECLEPVGDNGKGVTNLPETNQPCTV